MAYADEIRSQRMLIVPMAFADVVMILSILIGHYCGPVYGAAFFAGLALVTFGMPVWLALIVAGVAGLGASARAVMIWIVITALVATAFAGRHLMSLGAQQTTSECNLQRGLSLGF